MFEDDDDAVDLPAGQLLDAAEVESTLAPAPGGRSRALTTQYKLDQLEKQRELQAAKRKQKGGSLLVASKENESGTGGGLRMAAFDGDDDDDEDNSDNDAPSQQIRAITDRQASVTQLRAKGRNPEIGKAAKKLQMLGLSDEVDHSEKKAVRAGFGDEVPGGGGAKAAAGRTREAEEEEEEAAGPGALTPMVDVSDVKVFVMTTIPKAQTTPVQCYIKRVRSGFQKLWPYYVLYSQDPDKFLLSGRRRKKNKQSTYLISTDEKDLSRKSDAYIGKCKSNFVGTEFTLWDSGANPKTLKPGEQVRTELGAVLYDKNVLGTNGPRKMHVMLPGTSHAGVRDKLQPTRMEDCMTTKIQKGDDSNYIKLVNKTPRWNESLGAFCLNFQGRVTVASVKNFQLVDERDENRIVLQFGKCSDDMFTMDYSYPLCALQAFQICLSSFDHKLACE